MFLHLLLHHEAWIASYKWKHHYSNYLNEYEVVIPLNSGVTSSKLVKWMSTVDMGILNVFDIETVSVACMMNEGWIRHFPFQL